MRKFLMGLIGMGVLLWGGTPAAHGQKATEMFIPVGQSPGLSNKVSVIGTIERIDPRDRIVAVVGPSGSWDVTVTDHTKIWLDKSKLRVTNRKGTFGDLRKGLLVEVKYERAEDKSKGKGPAEWIKVQITESNPNTGETPQ